MKKRDWLIVIGILPFIVLLDQITKTWALNNLAELKFHGILGLVLHRNPGAILGTFSDLPPLLRVVSLSTGGAFLIFIYLCIQYLMPLRSMMLRCGMSILLGGIIGNVMDRIFHGSVTDFIVFGVQNFNSPAFNVADAVQWVGYGLVVYGLIKEGNIFWPDKNARKKVWVNARFQLKYCFMLMGMGLSFAIINGVFAYTFMKVTINELVVSSNSLIESRFLVPFLEVYAVMTIAFIIMLFLLGRLLSHRTAGPIYAFEKYIEDILAGKDRGFKLRNGDEFRELESLAKRVREHMHEKGSLKKVP
jgi:signal peptidase II